MTMLALLIKASVLMAAGFGAALACRRAAAATRHMMWTFVVAALLALPALTLTLPLRVTIPVAPRATAALARVTSPWLTVEAAGTGTATVDPAAATRSTGGVSRSSRWLRIDVLPGAVYAAGVLFLLLRLVAQYLVVQRDLRRAAPVHGADWIQDLAASAAALGLKRPVAVRRTLDHVMPFVLGIRRSTVIVPATADLWPGDRRRAVLLHELAHVSRRDCLVQMLTAVACALYWVHPGVWWIARRMRVEQELACDDRVLTAGTEPVAYAGHLLELAHSLPGRTASSLATAMAGAGQIERRIRALVERGRPPLLLSRRARLMAVVCAAVLVVSLATLDPRAEPAPLLAIQEAPAATFDVVSVKPNQSVETGGQISRRGGGLTIVNQTLRTLIQFAYQLQPSQLVDAPDWIDRERFDINARTSLKLPLPRLGEASQESLMFRAVLAERFNLRVRREPRPQQVYALVAARTDGRLGPNLRRPSNDFCERRFQAESSGAAPPADFGSGQVCGIRGSNDQLTAGSFPLTAFVNFLSGQARRIVIDRTNLTGVWDFELKWTPTDAANTDPDRPSIFTALEEQLGLKLESTTAPVDVLVVERVERPTPD
jgi:uncharacterized protein (TIGR03435 family)